MRKAILYAACLWVFVLVAVPARTGSAIVGEKDAILRHAAVLHVSAHHFPMNDDAYRYVVALNATLVLDTPDSRMKGAVTRGHWRVVRPRKLPPSE